MEIMHLLGEVFGLVFGVSGAEGWRRPSRFEFLNCKTAMVSWFECSCWFEFFEFLNLNCVVGLNF